MDANISESVPSHCLHLAVCLCSPPAGQLACSLGDAVKTPAPDEMLGLHPPSRLSGGCRMNSCWLIVGLCKRIPYFLLGPLFQTAAAENLGSAISVSVLHVCVCAVCGFRKLSCLTFKITVLTLEPSISSDFSVLTFSAGTWKCIFVDSLDLCIFLLASQGRECDFLFLFFPFNISNGKIGAW